MFPRFRQQLLSRLDLVVEFSTLGEYGIDEDGGVMALDPEPTPNRLVTRVRDRCGDDAAERSCLSSTGSGPVVRVRS